MQKNYMIKEDQEHKLAEKIASYEGNLDKIIHSDYPTNPKHKKTHELRVEHARRYLEELPELKVLLGYGLTIKVVPFSQFEQKLEKATYSNVEFAGEFCKVATFANYPCPKQWMVAMKSLRDL